MIELSSRNMCYLYLYDALCNAILFLQASLDEERNTYLKLAETGATLYFVIKSLSAVNCMYRFSLTSFLSVFKEALGVR